MLTYLTTMTLIGALYGPSADVGQAQYRVDPGSPRQVVSGFGIELQADSIGSGNNGLPEATIGVPHDLVASERQRLARDMLTGFRYVRLAGGLYWRGLDSEGRQLQPRWPEQLAELHTLMDAAKIEGVSFEYWSPPPYWKVNRSYLAAVEGDPQNTLRPFGKAFAEDSDYHGDQKRFFADFSTAVVNDIRTLEAAGIKVSYFGLQNEPGVSHDYYSSNRYNSSADYVAAFVPTAQKIRATFPSIKIIADTGDKYPNFIAPALSDKTVSDLIDAYVVHTVGVEASTVRDTDARLKALPVPKPWFQNEYEYTTGGATPERTLNTVAHIIASFEEAGNPTWFWLHALKPVGNAEASGYALGFWTPSNAKTDGARAADWRRWDHGPAIEGLPEGLRALEYVYARPAKAIEATGYRFHVDKPVRIYMLVQGEAPTGWRMSPLSTGWRDAQGQAIQDRIFEKTFPAGDVWIPVSGSAVPNASFVEPLGGGTVAVEIGINSPIYVRSQVQVVIEATKNLPKGHWTYNMLNWSAVGSFIKNMPWDSVVLAVSSPRPDPDVSLLAFRSPGGKITLVAANRAHTPKRVAIDAGIASAWKRVAYTPTQTGPHDTGVPQKALKGQTLELVLAPLSWQFVVQQ